MQPVSGLSSIAHRYDAFLLDLWGVVHDGGALYPGVKDALVLLRGERKRVLFLSNAPRRAHKVAAVLEQLGVERGLYDTVVSSGEVGHAWMASRPLATGRYFFIGPEHDADVLDGLDYRRVERIAQAHFVLNVGFGGEEEALGGFSHTLQEARAFGLTMVCLNPDMEVVKITGERYPCAGVIAKEYEAMGGEVLWFGKPYPQVYARCLELLQGVRKERILAVGDSIGTDVLGAVRAGIDCALASGGILKGRTPQEIETLCDAANAHPHYIMPGL